MHLYPSRGIHGHGQFMVATCLVLAGLLFLTLSLGNGEFDEHGIQAAQSVRLVGDLVWFFNEPLHDYVLPFAWLATVLLYAACKRFEVAAFFALAALIIPANHLLKLLIDRPRPSGEFAVLEFPQSSSFPSGHTTLAMGFFGAWFLLAGHLLPTRAALVVRSVAIAAIAFAAFSRLWTGAHWPTDVLAAILFGAAFLAILRVALPIPCERCTPETEPRPNGSGPR